MRGAALAVPFLLLLLPLPADGQGSVLGVRVIEDPAGDVMLQNPSGTPITGSNDRNAYLDIRALDIEEHADGYGVHLWVAGPPPDPGLAFFEEGYHLVGFAHDTVAFQVLIYTAQGGESASLSSDPGGTGDFGHVADLDASVDLANGYLSAFVPRDLLADRDGAPPFPGRSLTRFTALARGIGTASDFNLNGQQFDISIYGMDEAAAPEDYVLPVRFGAAQSGTASLVSTRPFRASNGEAATFIFQVEASNDAEDERLFRLEATGVPAGWQVTFPQPELRLEGFESRSVPVLATVPFAHQHGRVATFQVELRDLQDTGSVGRVELGLHYTDPPQPAGHHPELYLHTRAPGEFGTAFGLFLGGFGPGATMNTNPEDPEDEGADVTGSFGNIEFPDRISFEWEIPLSPQLQMGLDSDLTRIGAIAVPFGTTLPMPAARMDGVVYASRTFDFQDFDEDEDDREEEQETYVVATIPPTAEADLLPGATHLFESTVVPSKEGDYIPYDPALNLVLVLNVSFSRPSGISGVESPLLKAGGHLSLPLLEYADPVDDLFAGAAGLALDLTEGTERRVPPGGSALVTLKAAGPAGHYDLRALGPEAAWVEIPAAGLEVNDDGLGGARVAVHAPADALPGTVVDLVLEASGGPADAVHSLVRLRVTVDPEAPDQAADIQSDGGKGAPGLPMALLALGLLAVALLRRRR